VGRHFQTNPPLTAAKALDTQLRKAGIRVAGKPRTGLTPAAPTVLATQVSPTIAQIVAMTNTPSDNFLAESLLKAIGAAFGGAGTTAAGATVVRSTVATLGAQPRYVDGSGLSRRDWTSPHEVVNLITAMDRSPLAVPFEASLPIAGRTGTLKNRMRHVTARGRCHAKTGTLAGVSSLAGYCDALGGHRIAFAFLMNHASDYWSHVHQDRMANALALYNGA
jgi:D-alanyl-D-alanine carboxypeptidase/D-alanyl-D-alanine-endopeptidase (penicillin-binding protein 4)